ncbi:hypothetical protein LX32DRAFT_350806 [Colletotrichum zoysiae]|uniref:Uncharacterized protein n=1 Tax=Colletotrichum zoysiae TaxID=1216348 RepID=A0AAD9HK75_9PEZI|nr:hypothetical protein LX32DRAFT_350806 [Colletotrichum zoysiae]
MWHRPNLHWRGYCRVGQQASLSLPPCVRVYCVCLSLAGWRNTSKNCICMSAIRPRVAGLGRLADAQGTIGRYPGLDLFGQSTAGVCVGVRRGNAVCAVHHLVCISRWQRCLMVRTRVRSQDFPRQVHGRPAPLSIPRSLSVADSTEPFLACRERREGNAHDSTQLGAPVSG